MVGTSPTIINYSALSLCKTLNNKAAKAAPNNGPTMKTQTCAKAAVVPGAPARSNPITSKISAILSPIAGVGANDKSMYEDIVGKPYNETNPPVTLTPEMINKLRLNYSYDQIVAGLVFDKCNVKLVSYSDSHKDTLTSLLASILGKDESDIDTLLSNMPAYLAENITNAEANEIANQIAEYITAYDDTECKLIIEPSIISKSTTLEFNIRPDYVNHHYMVPVLNNIIILINAVSK